MRALLSLAWPPLRKQEGEGAAMPDYTLLSPVMTVFTFSVTCNSSSRGYHVYQSIWLNPSRDDELADLRMRSRLEMLSQGSAQ